MPDVVRVGRTIYGWQSCAFRLDTQPWKGILDHQYEQKRERKIVYAARQDGLPLGWTSGKYSCPTFTIKMLRDSAEVATDYLSTKGNGSYGDAEFSWQTQVVEPVRGMRPLTVIAPYCVITGKKDGHAEGIDELVTEFEIACLFLTENNKRLWSAVRSLMDNAA